MQLNGSRKVMGTLRGYDVRSFSLPPSSKTLFLYKASDAPEASSRLGGRARRASLPKKKQNRSSRAIQVFLNIVLDDAVEEKAGGDKVRIGQVVR